MQRHWREKTPVPVAILKPGTPLKFITDREITNTFKSRREGELYSRLDLLQDPGRSDLDAEGTLPCWETWLK